MTKKLAEKVARVGKMKKESFYVLIRRRTALSFNWGCYGKKGVYTDHKPERGDVIMRVVETSRTPRWRSVK